jgi:DnaJ-class molecular chaperone
MNDASLDPWEVLGIPPGSDAATIRTAWRDAARTHHPDAGGDAEAFKRAQWAFTCLAESVGGSSRSGTAAAPTAPTPPRAPVPRDGEPGERIMVEVMVDHAVAVFGGDAPITRWRLVHCPSCDGAGDLCTLCRGDGRVGRYQSLRVEIPPRSVHGDVLSVIGAGDAGKRRRNASGRPVTNAGAYGRLDVRILVDRDQRFIESGDDLVVGATVTMYDAALGGTVEVPGLDGVHRCTIPAGTQPGERVRIAGRGRPRIDGGRGDLVVVIQVSIPRYLDDTAREGLDALRARGV